MDISHNHFSNPQDVTQAIMAKSFLKKRQSKRQMGSGSQFFKNNGIRSCSYVAQTKNGLKAIPYYDKRKKEVLSSNIESNKSWSSSIYSNKGSECAGMGLKKPLVPYSPNATRNCMNVSNFKPKYPNSSHIQIGLRSLRDTKHYHSTYQNDLIYESKKIQSSNPAIQAYKNKWIRDRMQK